MNNLAHSLPGGTASISALRLAPDVARSFGNPNHMLTMLEKLSGMGDMVRVEKPARMPSTHFIFHPERITEVLRKNRRSLELSKKQVKMLVKSDAERCPTIVNSIGKEWQQGRRQLAKHVDAKRGVRPEVLDKTAKVIDAQMSSWSGADNIILADEISHLILRLGYKTMFDQDVSQKTCAKFEQAARRLHTHQFTVALSEGVLRPISLQRPSVQNALEAFHKEVISVRDQHLSKSDRSVLLDDLVDAENPDIAAERISMMMRASHTTMAYSLFNILWNISDRPDLQERIAANDSSDLIMEQVIKETLRLTPATYVIPKDVIEDIVLEDGYSFGTGDTVVISPYITNRSPDFYDNPEVFDPEQNFDPEVVKVRHEDAFISYGVGARKCPGRAMAEQLLSQATTKMCQQFEFSRIGSEEPKPQATFMMLPDSTTRLAIQPR